MITVLIYFGYVLGVVVGLVLIVLMIFWVHVLIDPFGMRITLKAVRKMCEENANCALEELTDVLEKMKTCPEIGNYIAPILVCDITYRLKAYVVGDKYGEPRFFVIDKEKRSDNEFHKITESKKFKRYGLSNSLSKEELEKMLNEASKVKYKKDLEEEQYKKIRNHFK